MGVPWELFFADDLVIIATSLEKCVERVKAWKEGLESKGLHVNMTKTKFMHNAGIVTDSRPRQTIPNSNRQHGIGLWSVCCRFEFGIVCLLSVTIPALCKWSVFNRCHISYLSVSNRAIPYWILPEMTPTGFTVSWATLAVGGRFIENFALFCQFRVCLVGVTEVWGESGKRTRVARMAALTRYRYATQPFYKKISEFSPPPTNE